VERWLEQGHSPREAARKAMDEVTGPIVAVALVLGAVFVPCAFIPGITGQFFRQFAVTIAVSTMISALNSLTLSPALSALLLRPHGAKKDLFARFLDWSLGWFFRGFNRFFAATTEGYTRGVGILLRGWVLVLVLYGGLLYLTYWSFGQVPQGFIPLQDKGWLLVNVQLPDSASVQRTIEVMKRIDKIARETPGVIHTNSVAGQSILLNANGSNFGSTFVILDGFSKRTAREKNGFVILLKLREIFAREIPEAVISVFPAPPVNGLGTAGGFKLIVEDLTYVGPEKLQTQTDNLVKKGNETGELIGLFTIYRSNTPQIFLDIDRLKVRSMDVSLNDVFQTLQVYLGSLYVNNFNVFGRSWQVNAMAEGDFRNRPAKLNLFKVKNRKNEMAPLGTVTKVENVGGPVLVQRYNLRYSAPINGNTAPGTSSGQAITIMDNLAEQNLPISMNTEWTELTYMQILAGDTALYIFALAVVLVFLVLAALYESWSLPMAVILVVPMCLLCSVAGVAAVPRMDVNIFTQIGFVVLVGLASKNAILIVEFAKQLREEGKPVFEATTDACRLRLRPIIMTSFAFLFGVVPLIVGHGAGAEMRKTLGVAVFSGMLGVTVFGIFLTPVFFYVIERWSEGRLMNLTVVRWVGSMTIGGAMGAVMGALFWHLRESHPVWAIPAGAVFGLGAGVLVLHIHRRGQRPTANAIVRRTYTGSLRETMRGNPPGEPGA
jgi:multidrug efflux pump